MPVQPEQNLKPTRRWLARAVFIAICAVAIVDVAPWGSLSTSPPIFATKELANATGIWQGQWHMFAPNPGVNHYWLSAEIVGPDGTREDWMSPYWPGISAWEKFLNFRSLNYYNRLCTRGYRHAAEDLADFLVRQKAAELGTSPEKISIKLYANGLSMADPPAGEMPPVDDITWVTFSELAAKRIGTDE